ncbi:forkhead box protein n3 [Plakobranchus ocellatus]|uniref:Forkhead box protein N3 n=1 Tax=Plakobranchus ocellatus TaxID=259542 RepID=A0AAV4B053_9GAST|nr:forkhead box protein n3 [Plakobranchus ocellatus]
MSPVGCSSSAGQKAELVLFLFHCLICAFMWALSPALTVGKGCEDTVPAAPTMTPLCKLPEESDASMRARLFTSLSQSFPHSQLYKALHGEADLVLNGADNNGDSEDDDDSLYGDHLSNSCFASLRMDRRDSDDFDDDLRSLEWLQSEDLLKNIGGEILDREDGDNSPAPGEQKENQDMKPELALLQGAVAHQPPHLPYMPQKHVNSKPPYSFSCLIFMAVEASPQKRLPVKDIYNWILTQFPYFQNAPTGWKNSVRHNLSLNKCFKKVEKDKGQSIGKGSLWCIDPAYRPNLLQALRKTPYHPYHQLQMTSTQPQNYMLYQSLPGSGRTVLPLTQRPVPNTVSPHLFPFLSRRLAQTSFDVDNEMKDVAQTLVALKGSIKKELPDNSANEDIGPTWRHHKRSYSSSASQHRPTSPVIVTNHPSLDHAYSSSRLLEDDAPSQSSSSSSSIDEEYDFGDADEECESDYESPMEWDSDAKDEVDGDIPGVPSTNSSRKGKLKIVEHEADKEIEDDEQKKLHEGASALLNLAGFLLDQSRERAGSVATSPGRDQRGAPGRAGPRQRKQIFNKGQATKKISQDKEVEEVVKKTPSKSKRKNAGNNAKYDNDDYTLGKANKTSVKSRRLSATESAKQRKAQAIKSPNGKAGRKVSKTLPKVKSPSGRVSSSHKAVKKKASDSKKLKLSKAFGKKTSNLNSSDGPVEENKKLKTSLTKTDILKNGVSKRAALSVSKRVQEENKVSVKEATVPNTPPLSSADNNNESPKSSMTTASGGAKSDGASALLAHNNNNVTNNNNNISKSTEVPDKAGLPNASGDAPVQIKCEQTADHLKEGQNLSSRLTPPPAASLSVIGKSHKSPHFTRFSKKKSALS